MVSRYVLMLRMFMLEDVLRNRRHCKSTLQFAELNKFRLQSRINTHAARSHENLEA